MQQINVYYIYGLSLKAINNNCDIDATLSGISVSLD